MLRAIQMSHLVGDSSIYRKQNSLNALCLFASVKFVLSNLRIYVCLYNTVYTHYELFDLQLTMNYYLFILIYGYVVNGTKERNV